MKKIILVLLIIVHFNYTNAQDKTTVSAKSEDISENLDLEVVASIFAEAKDLEDFEKKLNDPETQVSNIDLNEDGEVDYLRVVETSEKDTHVVLLQVVIGDDQYQDVATIDVEKDKKGDTTVQVIGDVYMYGPDYIITPVYKAPPVIFVWFWGPLYNPWRSPYYWGYYPPYYRPWRPYPPHVYRSNVRVHVSVHHTYRHTTVRVSKNSVRIHKTVSRNSYAKRHPSKSFSHRNTGIKNKSALKKSTPKYSTGKKTNQNWNNKNPKNTNKGTTKPKITPNNYNKSKPQTQKPTAKPQIKKPVTRPKPQMNRPKTSAKRMR